MCVYLYIHSKYTQNTYIYYANKLLFWMQLFNESFDSTNIYLCMNGQLHFLMFKNPVFYYVIMFLLC